MMSKRDLDVLVVDDNDDDAELSMYSLRRLDRQLAILRVKDGEQALDYLFRSGMFRPRPAGNPRLVLLDLDMPRIAGFEVLKRIRNAPQMQEIAVVMFTACSNAIAVEQACALGANRYVTKPATFDEYRTQIEDIARECLVPTRAAMPGEARNVDASSRASLTAFR